MTPPAPSHRTNRSERGFTILELLVSITVVGILSAIALLQLAERKRSAFNARAETDLRNIVVAQSAYFTEHDEYQSCDSSDCVAKLPGLQLSDGVVVTVTALDNNQRWEGEASHPSGNLVYHYSTATDQVITHTASP